jgi:hypothetical protein
MESSPCKCEKRLLFYGSDIGSVDSDCRRQISVALIWYVMILLVLLQLS